jgi:hypothetical protein
MTDYPSKDDNSAKAALGAADDLISRVQDETAPALKPGSTKEDAEEALLNIVDEMEAAPEIREVREALGEDPGRYGSRPGAPNGVHHPTDAEMVAESGVGSSGELLNDGQKEVFSRAEIEGGLTEHKADT